MSAVLVAKWSSLLEVAPKETVELCAPIVLDIDAWSVEVPLGTVSLGEEDTNEDDVLEDVAKDMTLADDVGACVLAELFTVIEFALEGRLVACDESDVTELFTAEVVVCDGVDTTGLLPVAKAEDMLTVELADCDESDLSELSIVLVNCKLEARLVLTLVTALDSGAGF